MKNATRTQRSGISNQTQARTPNCEISIRTQGQRLPGNGSASFAATLSLINLARKSPLTSTLATVKVCAGQNLTGHSPTPQTYSARLGADAAALTSIPTGIPTLKGYTLIGGEHLTIARAAYLIYSDVDEDVLEQGTVTHPIFKPDWSPELIAHVDYIAPSGWIRTALAASRDFTRVTIQHVPPVLMHRRQPRVIEDRLVQPTERVSVFICSRNLKMLGACLESIRSKTSQANGRFDTINDPYFGVSSSLSTHKNVNSRRYPRSLNDASPTMEPTFGPHNAGVVGDECAMKR